MTRAALVAILAAVILAVASAQELPMALDKDAEKWVQTTFKSLSLGDKVGQMVVSALDSTYLSSDTDEFERLAQKVSTLHLGGMIIFGGSERAPSVLLDSNYGSVILGQPLEAASALNRLQTLSPIPLINSSDFEAGVGFRINGATLFPRAMAFGAAGDEQLAFDAARITAIESRALNVQLDFSPIADVNNNPRNPVINTRSFGEVPGAVGRLASAYIRGLHAGGMLATLKHFPGHGDTDVDSHLGLPIITSRWRSIPEMLPPGYPGLVDAKSPEQVAESLIQLATLDLGGELRQLFLNRFTLEKHLASMAEAIRSVDADKS